MYKVTNGTETKFYRYLGYAINYMYKLGKGASITDAKTGELVWRL